VEDFKYHIKIGEDYYGFNEIEWVETKEELDKTLDYTGAKVFLPIGFPIKEARDKLEDFGYFVGFVSNGARHAYVRQASQVMFAPLDGSKPIFIKLPKKKKNEKDTI